MRFKDILYSERNPIRPLFWDGIFAEKCFQAILGYQLRMMDFILLVYKELINVLDSHGYSFQPFGFFLENPASNVVILRHDVDKLPVNALKMAMLEHDLGVKASYFFRAVSESFDEGIIRQIGTLGHEVGYHYEDLSLAGGDPQKAIRHFEVQLTRFRRIYPVKTICMHGSPLSRHDNRDLWKHYDYRDWGIIGEPYFDVNFKEVFYITDTGRKWNNESVSVRDRVASGFDIRIKNTFHLIALAEQCVLPDQMMITVHPQRWNEFGVRWIKELVGQNIMNVAKAALIKIRG